MRNDHVRKALGYLWGTLAVLLLWWLLSICLATPALPTPFEAICELIGQWNTISPEFLISALRILGAMLVGTIVGAPVGLLLGRSSAADKIFGPILYILYPFPKIVLLPILFVLFGIGGEAKVILIAIAVFFQMLVTMRDAAKAVPEDMIDSARSLGATPVRAFVDITVPLSLPALFTALRITTGTAVAILFIAESMAGSSGLGYYIMHSWSMLEYSQMFAGVVAMAILGVLMYEIFDIAERISTHSAVS